MCLFQEPFGCLILLDIVSEGKYANFCLCKAYGNLITLFISFSFFQRIGVQFIEVHAGFYLTWVLCGFKKFESLPRYHFY